jgi:SAM-dependent methyltransferase
VDVACTVAAGNLDALDDLVALAASWPRTASLALRFVAPLADSPAGSWPPAALVSERVAAALDRAAALDPAVGLAWEGFPPCLLPAHAALRDERLRYGVPAFGPPADGPSFPREDPTTRSHPFPCQECRYEGSCPGAPAAFLAQDGEGALVPTRAVRANSFNFEWTRRVPGFVVSARDCSARSLPLPAGALRSLLLVSADGVDLYQTATGDFSDREVRRVKDELAQVYLDPSASATLFDVDFTSLVRRTRPHAECRRCPDRPRCCGAVVVDPTPPFAVAEATLRGEVEQAAGRVLDVGCGEQPYAAALAAAVRAGRVEYHGLDPDAAALETFRAKGVGGTLHRGTIEDFEAPTASFDVVLAFRSLNHFRDLPRAFGRIARLLRPGGTLVLCDAAPFAMLRTARQVTFADTHAPHGHEHFRNWTSEQVLAFLERFPFAVEAHRPVAPDQPAEWFLKLRRRAD